MCVCVCVCTNTETSHRQRTHWIFLLNFVRVCVHKCHIKLTDAPVLLTDWQMDKKKLANPSIILLLKSWNEMKIMTPLHKVTAELWHNTTESLKANTYTHVAIFIDYYSRRIWTLLGTDLLHKNQQFKIVIILNTYVF